MTNILHTSGIQIKCSGRVSICCSVGKNCTMWQSWISQQTSNGLNGRTCVQHNWYTGYNQKNSNFIVKIKVAILHDNVIRIAQSTIGITENYIKCILMSRSSFPILHQNTIVSNNLSGKYFMWQKVFSQNRWILCCPHPIIFLFPELLHCWLKINNFNSKSLAHPMIVML